MYVCFFDEKKVTYQKKYKSRTFFFRPRAHTMDSTYAETIRSGSQTEKVVRSNVVPTGNADWQKIPARGKSGEPFDGDAKFVFINGKRIWKCPRCSGDTFNGGGSGSEKNKFLCRDEECGLRWTQLLVASKEGSFDVRYSNFSLPSERSSQAYSCRRCGAIKKGHVCTFRPRQPTVQSKPCFTRDPGGEPTVHESAAALSSSSEPQDAEVAEPCIVAQAAQFEPQPEIGVEEDDAQRTMVRLQEEYSSMDETSRVDDAPTSQVLYESDIIESDTDDASFRSVNTGCDVFREVKSSSWVYAVLAAAGHMDHVQNPSPKDRAWDVYCRAECEVYMEEQNVAALVNVTDNNIEPHIAGLASLFKVTIVVCKEDAAGDIGAVHTAFKFIPSSDGDRVQVCDWGIMELQDYTATDTPPTIHIMRKVDNSYSALLRRESPICLELGDHLMINFAQSARQNARVERRKRKERAWAAEDQ